MGNEISSYQNIGDASSAEQQHKEEISIDTSPHDARRYRTRGSSSAPTAVASRGIMSPTFYRYTDRQFRDIYRLDSKIGELQ